MSSPNILGTLCGLGLVAMLSSLGVYLLVVTLREHRESHHDQGH